MKKIEDYKGKKVLIECQNSRQWETLAEMAGNVTKGVFYRSNKCIDLYNGGYWASTTKETLINQGFTLYSAQDFLHSRTSLIIF